MLYYLLHKFYLHEICNKTCKNFGAWMALGYFFQANQAKHFRVAGFLVMLFLIVYLST